MKTKFDSLVELLMSERYYPSNIPFTPERSLSSLKSEREELKQRFMRHEEGPKRDMLKQKWIKINKEIEKLENKKPYKPSPFDKFNN